MTLRLAVPEVDLYAPMYPAERQDVARLEMKTLIACYRDRVNARKEGAMRIGDIAALRRQAELYRRDVEELWALVTEFEQLEARNA